MSFLKGKFGPEFILASKINQANGVAGLDGSGKIPSALIPALDVLGGLQYQGVISAAGGAYPDNATAEVGDLYVVSEAGTIETVSFNKGDLILWDGSEWNAIHSPVDTDQLREGALNQYFTDARALAALAPALALKADAIHTHVVGDVTGLQTALDSKAALVHTHVIGDVTGLQSALDLKATVASVDAVQAEVDALEIVVAGKADAVHAHVIADVTDLQSELDSKALQTGLDALEVVVDGKANTIHAHAIADVTGLQAALDAKAALVHTHAISDVTGLQAALDLKADITYVDSTVASAIAAIPAPFVRTKERFVLNSTHIAQGFVALAHTALPYSIVAGVQGLGLIEESLNGTDGDYTLANVGGVTQLTWINDLIGAAALAAGDVIYVQYSY